MSIARPLTARQRHAQVLALLVTALGVTVAIGWIFGLHIPNILEPGRVSMKPNTAILLIVYGISLAVMSIRERGNHTRVVVTAVALLGISLATFNLIESYYGWNLFVDHWLFQLAGLANESSVYVGVSPPAAYCLLLAGIFLLFASYPGRMNFRVPVLLALCTTIFLIGLLSLSGHLALALFDVHFWNFIGVTVHTYFGLCLLGGALFAWLRSEVALTWSLDKKTTVGFVLGIVAILAVAGLSYSFTYELWDDSKWVTHSEEALKEIQSLTSSQRDLTLSLGRYLITGDESFVADRVRIESNITTNADRLRSLTLDNSSQQLRLDALLRLTEGRVAASNEIIATSRQKAEARRAALESLARTTAPPSTPSGSGAAGSVLGTSYPALGEQTDTVLAAMEKEEYRLLKQRQARAEENATRTFLLMPASVYLSLTMLLLGMFSLDGSIAERKRSQAALAVREAELRVIFDHLNEGIVVRDRDNKTTYINRAAVAQYVAYPQGEIIVSLDGVPLSREKWPSRRAAMGDYVHNLQLGMKRSEGAPMRFMEFNTAPVFDALGQPSQFIVAMRDITERRVAEEARSEVEAYFRAIFEVTPDSIVVADTHGRIVMANPQTGRMFGYDDQAMPGLLMETFLPAMNLVNLERERLNLIGKPGYAVGNAWETDARRKDGSMFVVEIRRSALTIARGNFIIGVVRDITERKRIDEARARLAAIVESSDMHRSRCSASRSCASFPTIEGRKSWTSWNGSGAARRSDRSRLFARERMGS